MNHGEKIFIIKNVNAFKVVSGLTQDNDESGEAKC